MERVKEPLIRITKRDNMPFWMRMCIRVGAVLIALLISDIFITASADGRGGFFEFFGSLFSGAFGANGASGCFCRIPRSFFSWRWRSLSRSK